MNGFGVTIRCANSGMMGSKDRRNEASELRFFMVKAIADVDVSGGLSFRLPLKGVGNWLSSVVKRA